MELLSPSAKQRQSLDLWLGKLLLTMGLFPLLRTLCSIIFEGLSTEICNCYGHLHFPPPPPSGLFHISLKSAEIAPVISVGCGS